MAMNASPSNRKAKSLQNEKKFEALEFQLPDSGASFMNDNAWISWIIPIALIDISERKVIGKDLQICLILASMKTFERFADE